jgi:hypothetical protein
MLETVHCACQACPACGYELKPPTLPPDEEFTLLWHKCGRCAMRWGHVLMDHDEANGHYDVDTWAETVPFAPVG